MQYNDTLKSETSDEVQLLKVTFLHNLFISPKNSFFIDYDIHLWSLSK